MQLANDGETLVKLLASTLNPTLRKQAEDELTKCHNTTGFTPTLLQLIMTDNIEMPVRQAGVIYLKNMISQYWPNDSAEASNLAKLPDSDKQLIRDNIIEAVIHSAEAIRAQLIVCVRTITTYDFPDKWTQIVDKVHHYIQSNNINSWYGALQAFYQLCKIYEYKSVKERDAYHNAMKILLPMFLQRLLQLNEDPSDLSVLTQKQIIKIFFTFIQFVLPLDVLDQNSITQWLEICNVISLRSIPNNVEKVDKEERPDLSWWKIKKWSLRTMNRIFERYGVPANCGKEYQEFANFFLKGYANNILTTILKQLEQYRNGIYTSPRVLQQCITFIEHAVSPSHTWKFLKLHMPVIIQEILFPLMCHTNEDDDLFENDPIEYIKQKYDVFEDFVSPVNAARQLVYHVTSKRKDMLHKTMMFSMQMLQNTSLQPRQKDGILHIVGAVAKILLKRAMYKDQVEQMLVTYVFPEFHSQHGFLRARACWSLKSFARIQFKAQENLVTVCNFIKHSILNDTCLPVNVEACIALQEILASEEEIEVNEVVKQNVAPHIQQIMLKMLNLIRDTENDDISNVIQRLIFVYEDEISLFAVDIMKHLVDTFLSVVKCVEDEPEESDTKDDKTITAVGILSTIESLLSVAEERAELITQLEHIVLPVIYAIVRNGIIDFYEELFQLVATLTARQITPQMWPVLFLLHDVFQNDASDYFTELMPVLHNYVTVDTKTFLSDQKYLECVFKMSKQALSANMEDDDSEMHAAKLMETIVLNCHGSIDHVIPSILEAVFQRLSKNIEDSELRTALLTVVISALWCSTDIVLRTLDSVTLMQNNGENMLLKFIQQWVSDIESFEGLHERKVSALGLCTLIELAPKRPHDLAHVIDKLLPACCTLYDDLEKVYQARAKEDNESDLQDFDDNLNDLESDEGSECEESDARKTSSSKQIDNNNNNNDDDNDDDDDDFDDEDDQWETVLESYKTCIDENEEVDEFIQFKNTLQSLQANQAQYYEALARGLTQEQVKQIQNIITVADRRAADKVSRKILANGGYNFQNSFQVPSTFNFSGGASS